MSFLVKSSQMPVYPPSNVSIVGAAYTVAVASNTTAISTHAALIVWLVCQFRTVSHPKMYAVPINSQSASAHYHACDDPQCSSENLAAEWPLGQEMKERELILPLLPSHLNQQAQVDSNSAASYSISAGWNRA